MRYINKAGSLRDLVVNGCVTINNARHIAHHGKLSDVGVSTIRLNECIGCADSMHKIRVVWRVPYAKKGPTLQTLGSTGSGLGHRYYKAFIGAWVDESEVSAGRVVSYVDSLPTMGMNNGSSDEVSKSLWPRKRKWYTECRTECHKCDLSPNSVSVRAREINNQRLNLRPPRGGGVSTFVSPHRPEANSGSSDASDHGNAPLNRSGATWADRVSRSSSPASGEQSTHAGGHNWPWYSPATDVATRGNYEPVAHVPELFVRPGDTSRNYIPPSDSNSYGRHPGQMIIPNSSHQRPPPSTMSYSGESELPEEYRGVDRGQFIVVPVDEFDLGPGLHCGQCDQD
jgi:hypothetical protein